MLSLSDARAKILERAEPGEAIEVCLAEAPGLVLAEPALADVDLPPFDRAGSDGYALRPGDAAPGSRLRVLGLCPPGSDPSDLEVEEDEAVRVEAGDPLPLGADAVAGTADCRLDPGPPRCIAILRAVEPGQNVVRRGASLRAGTVLAPAGTRIYPAMVGLLASQGCIHPVCHRRVRVAVLAVGDHLVGPGEAPVMHRERNAAGPTVVAPCLAAGATAHDLGTVFEVDLDDALARALTAPIVVIFGPAEGAIPPALVRAGVEPVVSGIALHPGSHMTYGVVPGPSGRVAQHVFHLPPCPIAALTLTTLLVVPLIGRLQGGPLDLSPPLRASWSGPDRPTGDRSWAIPVTLEVDDRALLRAVPVEGHGDDDLLGFSRAEALALLSPRPGPWRDGEVVEVAPLGPWPSSGI